jgi:hypothetical protein
MLCGLLVFCVPAFPQAINSLGIPKVLSEISLLLALRKTSEQASRGNGEESWQQNDYSGGKAKSYKHIDEHSLQPLSIARSTSEERGIICTTEFTSVETSISNGMGGKYTNQYP